MIKHDYAKDVQPMPASGIQRSVAHRIVRSVINIFGAVVTVAGMTAMVCLNAVYLVGTDRIETIIKKGVANAYSHTQNW